MWHKEYRDYPTDQDNVKHPVEPGRGIIGCEMHEIYGWGNTFHYKRHEDKKNPAEQESNKRAVK